MRIYRVRGSIYLRAKVAKIIAPYVSLVIEAESEKQANKTAASMHKARHRYKHIRTERLENE